MDGAHLSPMGIWRGEVPPPAVRFLRYLIATKKTGEQAMRVLAD